jgi:hypothetical protein
VLLTRVRYLIHGVQAAEEARLEAEAEAAGGGAARAASLARARLAFSGKLVLLDKLLPQLKAEGHRVRLEIAVYL